MLEVRDLSVSYGKHRALEDVSVRVGKGEIVVILGANGAGKSTLLRAIGGICEGQQSGQVNIDGKTLIGLSSDRIVEEGIALVPEGRGIFGDLTVRENLTLGAYSNRARADEVTNLERVMALFPKLGERQGQIARTMSGGEQQMVAIGRAMMSNPSILMLDEPSLGLSPLLCKELFQNLSVVRKTGIGILLVEQNAKQSLAISDRGYLLENAHIVHEADAASLARDPAVQKAYLGAGSAHAGKSPAKTAATPRVEEPVQETRPATAPTNLSGEARPQRRMTANELLGQSLDAMVARASAKSLETRTDSRASPDPRGHDQRLAATLRDIEQSARVARERKPRNGTLNQTASTTPTHAAPPQPQPPVVIEVYRAPRVEVFRRRPGSKEFDRD